MSLRKQAKPQPLDPKTLERAEDYRDAYGSRIIVICTEPQIKFSQQEGRKEGGTWALLLLVQSEWLRVVVPLREWQEFN